MSCLPCFSSKRSPSLSELEDPTALGFGQNSSSEGGQTPNEGSISAKTFTFRELAAATQNFQPDYLIGEGAYGRVYKGVLEDDDRDVAIKQLDRHSYQGNKEFITEISKLSSLHQPNIVNLIGYCADGDQRLLVFDYFPKGSVESNLFDLSDDQEPLSWYIRMNVAYGVAQGLEYMHDHVNPPVIYRDLRPSKILIDDNFNPKLTYPLCSRRGQMGGLMNTYGSSAPECGKSGKPTVKSDVYSFGVFVLELLSGRRVVDNERPPNEQNLIQWGKPMFRDQKRYHELVDPLIKGECPAKELNQVVAVCAMCLQDEASVRPFIADVVMTLSFLGKNNAGPASFS